MATVDSLDIEISASAAKANAALDALVNRLQKVSSSLQSVNSSGLNNFSNGINNLSKAMQTFNASTKTADFSRLKRNLESLAGIKVSGNFTNLANAMGRLSAAVSATSFAFTGTNTISDFAKNVSKLGSVSVAKAITNMNGLTVGISNMMVKLSKAPRVSQNVIDMTNAMARFASTGSSGARSAIALTKSFDRFSNSTGRATKKSFSLASAIGKLYATYWMLFRAMRGIGKSIDYASQIQEVQNVVDNTFGVYIGQLDKLVNNSINELGMSELTVKKIASTYQAMGKAMGFAQNEMTTMSVDLTRLTADMASFYDVEQKAVAEDLQSIFTGMTKPLRQYGLDLTQATLKEYALANGLNADFQNMTQMEKAMLRYRYVMDNTKVAQGDFAKTSGSWANQIRILKENFVQLGNVIGRTFIAALKPLVSALNSVMQVIIQFATLVSNALGQIFGWKFENFSGGTIADPFEDAEDASGGIADNTGKAADNAKKLKQQLQGIDELNVLNSNKDNGGGGGSGGSGAGSGTENKPAWTTTETIFDYFKSNIKDLETLGTTIRDSLINAMKGIKWDDIYKQAENFGKGLADFLNGLFSSDKNGDSVFSELGTTIAGALNTALHFLNTIFSDPEDGGIDFKAVGESLSKGLLNLWTGFDWVLFAQTCNNFVDSLKNFIKGFFVDENGKSRFTWKDILEGPLEFLDALELDTVLLAIGAFAWFHGGKKMALSALGSILAKEIPVGVGSLSVPLSTTLAITAIVAIIGYKIGNELYDHVPSIQEWADGFVGLMGDLFTKQITFTEFATGMINLQLNWVAKIFKLTNEDGTPMTGEDLSEKVQEAIRSLWTKPADFAYELGLKLGGLIVDAKAKIVDWYESLPPSIRKIIDFTAKIIGFNDSPLNGSKFINFVAKIISWKEFINGGKYINFVAKIISWLLGFPKNTNFTISDFIAKVTSWILGITTKNGKIGTLGSFTANIASWVLGIGTTGKKKTIATLGNFTANIASWIKDSKLNTTISFRANITSVFGVGWEALNKAFGNKKAKGGSFYNGKWHDIAQYANGGIPTHGSLFYAGEAGAEVVGHVGGRTEVLNESQLASTMYSAVFSAMQAASGNNSQPVQVYLDGKVVFDSTRQYAQDYTRRTGIPAF